jgi:hypothetical protein
VTTPDDYLARVGIPSPGGDPNRIQASANVWREVDQRLETCVDDLTRLTGSTLQGWHGATADAFTNSSAAAVGNLQILRQSARQLGDGQAQHASNHAQALEVLREIAIQIAITLAFVALSSFLPELLAAIEARLALLAAQAGRVVSFLDSSLTMLLRGIAEVRSGLRALLDWTVTTEQFSLPVGRSLVEGTRDFAVDLATTSTAAKIEGKPISVAQLLISAAISGGVGGLIPAVGRLGVFSEVSGRYISADDVYRRIINPRPSETGHLAPASTPLEPTLTSAQNVFDRLTVARGEAMKHELSGTATEFKMLSRDLVASQSEHDVAQRALQLASSQSDELTRLASARGLALSARESEAVHAGAESWVANQMHSMKTKLSDDPAEISASAERLANSQTRANDALHAYHEEYVNHQAAVAQRDRAIGNVSQVRADASGPAERLAYAQQRAQAWQELADARAAVLSGTTQTEQVAYALKHNLWRDGMATDFHTVESTGRQEMVPSDWQRGDLGERPMSGVGQPKWWREVLMYDTVKDGFKGTLTGVAYTGYQVAQGQASADDIGIAAGLGAAGGATRGLSKGSAQGRLFPAEGPEEIVWRIGTKGLDKMIRDKIKEAIEPPPAPPPAAESP